MWTTKNFYQNRKENDTCDYDKEQTVKISDIDNVKIFVGEIVSKKTYWKQRRRERKKNNLLNYVLKTNGGVTRKIDNENEKKALLRIKNRKLWRAI